MTRAKAIYQECYKQKSTEFLPKEVLKYSSKECPICKDKDINANYKFCIYTYLDYLTNQDMQILPFCSDCMDAGYLYSMSRDKMIYFTCKDDKHVYMLHMPEFIQIRGKIVKTPVDDWNVIRLKNHKTKEVKYIKRFSWIEDQLVPCFHIPPTVSDLPKDYVGMNKTRYGIVVPTYVASVPIVSTPVTPIPEVIKKFKIYSLLKTTQIM